MNNKNKGVSYLIAVVVIVVALGVVAMSQRKSSGSNSGGSGATSTPTTASSSNENIFSEGGNSQKQSLFDLIQNTPTPSSPPRPITPLPTFPVNHDTPTVTPPVATATPTPTIPAVSPKPGEGIWISQAEIASRRMSGSTWTAMKSAADSGMDAAELYNQDSHHPEQVLAAAFVFARTADAVYATKVRDELLKIAAYTGPQTTGAQDGRSLALGRNLMAYVIAADVIGLKNFDATADKKFRAFLTQVRNWTNTEGRSLIQCHEIRPNNWGTMCGASRIAADRYLADTSDLNRAATVFRGFVGDRSAYAGFDFGASSDPSYTWMCGINSSSNVGNERPINPSTCVKDGHDLSGAPPSDMDREGPYTWPPRDTTAYPAGAISAAVAQAEMLFRAGFDAFNWENKALLRAEIFLHTNTPNSFTPATDWMDFVINKRYGTNFAVNTSYRGFGRLMDWGAWTHGP